MNQKATIIIASIILGLILTCCGAYYTIDNLVSPSGLLFEGIIGMSMGVLILLMVVVASTVGKTIIMFGQILEQQGELHRSLQEEIVRRNQAPGLSSLLSGLMPGSITITDMDSGETSTSELGKADSIKKINDIISGAMSGFKELSDMSIEELEKELAKALKKDNFERAEEVSKAIKAKKGK